MIINPLLFCGLVLMIAGCFGFMGYIFGSTRKESEKRSKKPNITVRKIKLDRPIDPAIKPSTPDCLTCFVDFFFHFNAIQTFDPKEKCPTCGKTHMDAFEELSTRVFDRSLMIDSTPGSDTVSTK